MFDPKQPHVFALAATCVLATTAARTAHAEEDALSPQAGAPSSAGNGAHRLGVGVEGLVNVDRTPFGAAEFVYDARAYRITGRLFLLSEEDDYSEFGVGGRFFYVLDHGDRADFSIGGGLAIVHRDLERGNDMTRIHLEGLAQIRYFATRNVAFSAGLGLGIGFGDDRFHFSIGGELTGSLGIAYFF